jgi:PD-(D/E)XK endonuclease
VRFEQDGTMRKTFLKSPATKTRKQNLAKAYPADQKERGEWVELLFMANAARMGLKVARPHGDSARFDVIVEDGGGKFYRVQVKSTTFNRNGCYECLCFWSRVSKTREAKQYSEKQIDCVAAYVVPEDSWFIIPVSELRTKTLYLPPRERAPRSRYGRFLEAWPLLGVDGSGLTIQASVESDVLLALIKAKVAEECR